MSRISPRARYTMILGILAIGLSTGLGLGIFWNNSVEIAGVKSSLPLYILFFVVGGCSSLSNVTHFAYVSVWPASNTTALSTGMGCGSMVAGVLALLQGTILVQKGFSVRIYYLVLASLYCPAVVAVYSLQRQGPPQSVPSYVSISSADNLFLLDSSKKEEGLFAAQETIHNDEEMDFLQDNYHVLTLQLINSMMGYGLIPSIISFVCGKFEDSSQTLLLATTIAAIVDPIFRASTYYLRFRSFAGLGCATMTLISLSCALLILANLPESSPIYSGNGGYLVVILYVTFNGLHVFTNTSIFRYFKEHVSPVAVPHSYRWGGMASQTGALVGTGITFACIITGVFG